MFNNKAIKELKAQIAELSEKVDRLAEKQNSHFTELMLAVRSDVHKYSDSNGYSDGDVNDDMFEEAKE